MSINPDELPGGDFALTLKPRAPQPVPAPSRRPRSQADFCRWFEYLRKAGIAAYAPLRAPWMSL
jgi:hypothetical protein